MPKMQDRAVPVRVQMEFRSTDKGTRFTGYAAVFNSDSEPLPFTERVMPGAFTRSLNGNPTQTLVLNHDDSLLLASRRAGNLTLTQDSTGLLAEADLPDVSYARDLRALNDAGEVWGMSFTFRPARGGEVWSPDRQRRELTDVALGHVTVLTGLQPAYPATSGLTSIRSLAEAIRVNPRDVEEVLDRIQQGRPLDARQKQILMQVAISVTDSDEPDGDEAEPDGDEAAAAEPGPSMAEANAVQVGGYEDGENPVEENSLHGRSLDEWKAYLAGKGLI